MLTDYKQVLAFCMMPRPTLEQLKVIDASSPAHLFTKWYFWKEQLPFTVILIVALFVILLLFDLTYPRSETAFGYLSLFIHVLALVGMYKGASSLASIYFEDAIADYVHRDVEQFIRSIDATEEKKVSLRDVQTRFHFKNEKMGMTRLFHHVIKEAATRRYDSSVLVMQPYRDETFSFIITLQSLQRIALQLGILGTFIGLILALSELDFSGELDVMRGSMGRLIDSLHFAFSTSIAGLEVAVLVGLIIMWVRKKQLAYFHTMERATIELLSIVRNIYIGDRAIAEFQEVNERINSLERRIEHQQEVIRHQSETLDGGIRQLIQTRGEFDSFLRGITTTQKLFIAEMQGIYDLLSPKKVSEQLESGLNAAVQQVANTFDATLSESMQGLTELQSSIAQLETLLSGLKGQTGEQAMQLKTLIEENKHFIEEAKSLSISVLSEDLRSSIQRAGNEVAGNVKAQMDQLAERIYWLNESLNKANRLTDKLLRHHPVRRTYFKFQDWLLKKFRL